MGKIATFKEMTRPDQETDSPWWKKGGSEVVVYM
jgi:hypothetical protein